ncbi:unnamed protein product [Lymnaea stagnalis]|uniref:Hexosyltransferase n=1 Tax=Lymnaea stagnalis TaxID=6523 RepID=A0AAV2HX29_LYMST
MKTYNIFRIRIQRWKRALKSIILGGVVLSLAGFALAFSNFWPDRHAEDHNGHNVRHIILKSKTGEIGVLYDQRGNMTERLRRIAPKVSTDGMDSEHDLNIKTQDTGLDDSNKQVDRNTKVDGNVKDDLNFQDQPVIQDGRNRKDGRDMHDDPNQSNERKPEVAGIASQEGESVDARLSANETMATEMLKAELEAKTVQVHLLSEPIIYNYNFADIRNPGDACAASKTQVLIVVASDPENFQRRIHVRTGSVGEYVREPANNAKLLFFMGRPPCGKDSVKIQSKIADEFRLHRDTVQVNFEDVLKNVRLKGVSMLKWAVTFCREARFVIRIDDDVTANIPKILPVMEAKSRQYFDFVIGDIKEGWKPVRKENVQYLKYSVSEDEYPEPTYPPFAVGGLVGYPMSTVSLLYQAALRLKPLWLDDVFITGICAVKLRVPLVRDRDFVFDRRQ